MAHLAAGTPSPIQDAGGAYPPADPAFDVIPDRFFITSATCPPDRAERQAADRPDKLFELAGGAGVHGPVTRIVRSGSQFG